MSDVIHLLPDSVANQIAAGEVIQRPASVVKELVENAIDAGATHIQLIIKDAGRTLIQVIDDGKGMSETDARLAFERHATSKIQQVNDLFALRTMGFRGEALASIAAIAHVELRTRRKEDELGTKISIAGSKVESQESVSCPTGSNFLVKNLFFNVPARRKFLKTNTTEFSHIEKEFFRIALVYPHISFEFWHNDQECYMLQSAGYRERIVNIFGKGINSQLLSINADSTLVKIYGFIGKPETAKKQNDKQFFFVNNRYMRHPYFHRAIMQAYDRMLQASTSPDYFIYFDINPENIDVNIHPTKTEIKFENEHAIFPVILTSVKEALGRFNVMPSIDFDQEGSPDIPVFNTSETVVQPPKININPEYNPFKTQDKPSYTRPKMDDWSKLYEGFENDKNRFVSQTEDAIEVFSRISDEDTDTDDTHSGDISFSVNMEGEENTVNYFQLKNKYILTSVKSGLMCIDQHRAHVRILFDRFLNNLIDKQTFSQKLLFPERLDLLSSEALILDEIKDDLLYLGFEISDLGNNSYAINSLPAMHSGQEAKPFILNMIDAVKDRNTNIKNEMLENVALSLAKMSAIPAGKSLLQEEMIGLINELFACSDHYFTPDNKTITAIIPHGEVDRLFK
jgi:DNA mismatch repair protein MutL